MPIDDPASSARSLLIEALARQGVVVEASPLAEKLRELVLNDPMDPLCEALLMFAARRDHLQQVIETALARREVVL